MISGSAPRPAQALCNSAADSLTGIGALMNGGSYQPTITAGISEAVLRACRHEDRITRLQFYGFAVQIHCTLPLQHVEDFMFMCMHVPGKFLARQKAQEAAVEFFFREQRHIGQRQFIAARKLRKMKDLPTG